VLSFEGGGRWKMSNNKHPQNEHMCLFSREVGDGGGWQIGTTSFSRVVGGGESVRLPALKTNVYALKTNTYASKTNAYASKMNEYVVFGGMVVVGQKTSIRAHSR
jgi:hypothetical protein